MATVLEQYVSFIYKDKITGEYSVFMPKTVAEQVITARGKTAATHVADYGLHLTNVDRQRFTDKNQANGVVLLDERGYIPLEFFHESMMTIKVEKPNIPALLAGAEIMPGALVMVLDASGDPTVKSNWAVYRRLNNSSYDDLTIGWEKVFEKETMDVPTDWETWCWEVKSTPAQIDHMVADEHTHANLTTLVKLTVDNKGRLMYDGEPIAFMKDVTKFIYDDNIIIGDNDDVIRNGDFWFKTSVGQSWWNDDSIEYAGSTLYEAYANMLITDAPKLRTQDVVNFRRTFYRCYNLASTQQYDTRNATDFVGMYKECSSLEAAPDLSTWKGLYYDEMFYGCSMLKIGPELYMVNPVTLVGMYSGCLNLTLIKDLGKTGTVTSFKDFANGCSSLEVIAGELDFTSVVDDAGTEGMFNDCIELRRLRIKSGSLKVSLDLSGTDLDMPSLLSVFDGLATGVPSGKTINLTGVATTADVDPSVITTATTKGWTVITSEGTFTPTTDADNYSIVDASDIANAISNVKNGDIITVETSVDTTGNPIAINGKRNINLILNEDIVVNGGRNGGIQITNGSAVISGTGKLVNNTPYSSSTSSGVLAVNENSSLTINGGGVDAVIEDDPVNKGQFGICAFKNSNLTINAGTFTTGWYCVSGNGKAENSDGNITINGGTFTSVADYAIYHPQNGTLTINGGTFVGAAGALAVNNGTVNITGGEFAVLGNGNTGEWADGTSGLADVAINLNARYGDVSCRISGGKFHATAAGTIMISTGTTHKVDLQITGGKFTSKPKDEWIAEGYACTDNKDSEGFYEVIRVL